MRRFSALIGFVLVSVFLVGSAFAEDFKCLDRAAVAAAAGPEASLVSVTPEQFQFLRGLYVATPPASSQLPPGDGAVVLRRGDAGALFFVDSGRLCAAGELNPGVLKLLVDVGEGKVEHVGDGT